jgi:hypothetical protein
MAVRGLFNGAVDFRVLSGGNQPPDILPGEYKDEQTAPWVLRSGIAQELPVHANDGDFVAQEANIELVELQRAVLEDSVITAVLFAEPWRISRNHAVDVGMLRLYGLSARPFASLRAASTQLASREFNTAATASTVESLRVALVMVRPLSLLSNLSLDRQRLDSDQSDVQPMFENKVNHKPGHNGDAVIQLHRWRHGNRPRRTPPERNAVCNRPRKEATK